MRMHLHWNKDAAALVLLRPAVTSHTVKWHLRNIYGKPGLAERDAAVARMRDLETSASHKAG